ncbi:unnamed protein product, partial [marine sediment metagenome]
AEVEEVLSGDNGHQHAEGQPMISPGQVMSEADISRLGV